MQAPTSYRVRNATDADSVAVTGLVSEVSGEFGLQSDALSYASDLGAVASAYGRDGGWFELLLADEELVGTLGMMVMAPGVVELRKMYLRPRARGLGLGKALLARNLHRARASGFEAVVLETATQLETARALYARFGFQREQGEGAGCSAGCDQRWRLLLRDYQQPVTPIVELTGARL